MSLRDSSVVSDVSALKEEDEVKVLGLVVFVRGFLNSVKKGIEAAPKK